VAARAWLQLLMVALGALAGLLFCRNLPALPEQEPAVGYGRKTGGILLALFLLLLCALPLAAYGTGGQMAVAAAFYRVGALVFGGGHVVLPLLQETVVSPGWLSVDEFLAGYGAAQAVPGPMFTLAAYLGARLPEGMGGLPGAAVALGSIFLPGFLLVAGVLPFWRALTRHPLAASAVAGVNAAVVGLLAAALYHPVWTGAVHGPTDLGIAMLGLAGLTVWRVSALAVVIWCVAASMAATLWF